MSGISNILQALRQRNVTRTISLTGSSSVSAAIDFRLPAFAWRVGP